MDFTFDSRDWGPHDEANLHPPVHTDADLDTVTSGYKQTADRSSSIQGLDPCDHLKRAAYSFDPLAASNMRHHPTPPIHQSFQQGHMPFPALAAAPIQPDTAMEISIVQPYAGLNPVGDELEHYREEIRVLYADNDVKSVRRKINNKYHLKAR